MPDLLAVCTLPPWPAGNGYALRVANLLGALAGHWRITLIAPPCTAPPWVAHHIPVQLAGGGLTYPWRFDAAPLRAAVAGALRVRPYERALVWPGAERLRPMLPPAVMDMIDCNTLEFCRGALARGGPRARLRSLRQVPPAVCSDRAAVRGFAAVACVGEDDAAWLRRIGGREVHVVPNGVALPDAAALPAEAAEPTLSFSGTLDYPPNVDAVLYAARDIWPSIRAAAPTARFCIAGWRPVARVRALDGHDGIDVQADVADMVGFLARSWVSIAPMREGVGIKNKVLEAWACARPVAMTKRATNGLSLPEGHAGLVANDATRLAEIVLNLFADPAARHAKGAAARTHIARHFTWAGAAARIDALLRRPAQVQNG